MNEASAPLLGLGGGAAMIFGPDGRPLADHLPEDQDGLVIADLDLDLIKLAKVVADPAGHYAKPEAARLLVSRAPLRPVAVCEIEADCLGFEPLDSTGRL